MIECKRAFLHISTLYVVYSKFSYRWIYLEVGTDRGNSSIKKWHQSGPSVKSSKKRHHTTHKFHEPTVEPFFNFSQNIFTMEPRADSTYYCATPQRSIQNNCLVSDLTAPSPPSRGAESERFAFKTPPRSGIEFPSLCSKQADIFEKPHSFKLAPRRSPPNLDGLFFHW
jgi:hypothetical protein